MEKKAALAVRKQVRELPPHFAGVDITLLLRERGYKVTPQRLAIFEILSGTDTHPSAEMLFYRLQPQHPAISLATVYKTIEMFKTVGVVAALNVGGDCFRYEIFSDDHPHLICTECHRVEDAAWLDCGDFTDTLQKRRAFTLHRQRFYFYGICAVCMRAKE